MDPAHILVAALTVLTFALLVWIEIRSRRNRAAEQSQPAAAHPSSTAHIKVEPPSTQPIERR